MKYEIDNSIFLDYNKIFAYNCPVNFIVTERGLRQIIWRKKICC